MMEPLNSAIFHIDKTESNATMIIKSVRNHLHSLQLAEPFFIKGVENMPTTKQSLKDGYYQIVSSKNGRLLDVDAMKIQENGALVQLYDNANGQNQQWRFVPVSENEYKLICRESGKALDIISGGVSDGAWLHQWDTTDTDSQVWELEQVSEDEYKIKSKLSGKCIDATLNEGNGVMVHIWQDVDAQSELWRLKLIEEIAPKKKTTKKKPTTRKKTAVTKTISKTTKTAAAKELAPKSKKTTTKKSPAKAETKPANKKATTTSEKNK